MTRYSYKSRVIKELKKAIRHFECMRDDNIVVLNSGFGTKKGEHNSLYKNRKMYAELAIETLEKQIPKKPIEKFGLYKCCACNGVVYESEYNFKYSYCPNCGTKIDWSEVNE